LHKDAVDEESIQPGEKETEVDEISTTNNEEITPEVG
jgi:hypothetical protein